MVHMCENGSEWLFLHHSNGLFMSKKMGQKVVGWNRTNRIANYTPVFLALLHLLEAWRRCQFWFELHIIAALDIIDSNCICPSAGFCLPPMRALPPASHPGLFSCCLAFSNQHKACLGSTAQHLLASGTYQGLLASSTKFNIPYSFFVVSAGSCFDIPCVLTDLMVC